MAAALSAAMLLAVWAADGAPAAAPSPKSIHVRLRASWRATPLLLEASEFFEAEGLFWPFALSAPVAGASTLATEEEAYGAVRAAAAALLGPLERQLLDTYLATSALSPRVEAQLADERARAGSLGVPAAAEWWAHACGRAHVPGGAQSLEQFLDALTCAGETPDADAAHAYAPATPRAPDAAPLLTLYATLGTPAFARAHEALRDAAEAGRVTYAHVHRFAPAPGSVASAAVGLEAAAVQGYGVALAIKNMEYKVIDDSTAKAAEIEMGDALDGADADAAAAAASGGGGVDGAYELSGFLFETLAARRPELAEPLGALRRSLAVAAADAADAAADASSLKVWALHDLGYQAAQRVAAAADPLGALREIAHNLPAAAAALTRARTDPRVKREAARNAERAWSAGQSALLLNGRPLPLADGDNDYFKALELVRAEVRLVAKVVRLGVPADAVPLLLAPGGAAAGGGAAGGGGGGGGGGCSVETLVAAGEPQPIVWLNNVERDAKFRQLPRSLAELAPPAPPGAQLTFLRRNLYSAVLVVDPTTADGADALQTAAALLQQGAPLRFGLVIARATDGAGAQLLEPRADAAAAGAGGAPAVPTSLAAALAAGWAAGAAAAELLAAGVALPAAAATPAAAPAPVLGLRALRGDHAAVALYARALSLAARLGGPSGASMFVLAAHELREGAGGGQEAAYMQMLMGGAGMPAAELEPLSADVLREALGHALGRTKHAHALAHVFDALAAGLDVSGGGDGGGHDEGGALAAATAQLAAALAQLDGAAADAVRAVVGVADSAADAYAATRALSRALPLLLLNGGAHALGERARETESLGRLDRVLMTGALANAEARARVLVRAGALADPPAAAAGAEPPPYDADELLRAMGVAERCPAQLDASALATGASADAAAAGRALALDGQASLLARRTYAQPPRAARAAEGARGCAAPALTLWAVVDLGTAAGVRIAAAALERLAASAAADGGADGAGEGGGGAPGGGARGGACARLSVVHRVDPRAPAAADGASASVSPSALTLALASAWESVLLAASAEEEMDDAADADADGADGATAERFGRTLDALRGVLLVGAAVTAEPAADASADALAARAMVAVAALRAQLRAHSARAAEAFASATQTVRVQALIALDSRWSAEQLDAPAAADAAADAADAPSGAGARAAAEAAAPGAAAGASAAAAAAAAAAAGYVLVNGRVLTEAVAARDAPGAERAERARAFDDDDDDDERDPSAAAAAAPPLGAAAIAAVESLELAESPLDVLSEALGRARGGAAAPSPAAARRDLADALLRVGSFLRAHADADGGGASERVRLGAGAGGLECEHACVALPALALAGGGADAGLSAALHLVALVDPLSRAAQRIAPVLSQLRAALGARVTVYLNPRGAHADLPLNEFYRFAAPHAPAFDERGRRVAHGARFAKLATAQTLTLHLDTPAGWLTEPSDCAHDMDNLRLADVGGGGEGKAGAVVTAEYRLAALLISGSCDDLSANEPPNGLQLVLAHAGAAAGARGAAGRPLADTLVMQNLGYFQLQASPGLFALRLEAGSRSEELYTLLELPAALRAPARARGRDGRRRQAATFDAAELAALEPVGERRIALRSFDGASATLLVRKRPGMERKRLLDGDAPAADGGRGRGGAQLAAGEGGESLWGKASSLWSGAAGARGGAAAADDDGKVHVFSLASGHLYERFLKIMMLSVAGKSSKPVKFWLIRNFLSASFMAFAPQLAREKGFEVEFVRYQWPPWLRAQSDKQRIIWGYKILFLDVLFPLGLKKVIYIDADQVVQSDIVELWNYDLKGRAVAMTPFCSKDANPHTTGFRFWAQGYWVDHLRGRPYHISALFVVDLARFRGRAQGDHYRVFYDNLSADPNSLANLDQDLPNYAQHSVPIASLPEHWLWCETWCGNASKAEARTIDLCNNPLTKEPKIEMAKRIIGQRWIDLDNEARAIELAVAANASVARGARDAASADGARPHDEL